jgi:hypothetical protein
MFRGARASEEAVVLGKPGAPPKSPLTASADSWIGGAAVSHPLRFFSPNRPLRPPHLHLPLYQISLAGKRIHRECKNCGDALFCVAQVSCCVGPLKVVAIHFLLVASLSGVRPSFDPPFPCYPRL